MMSACSNSYVIPSPHIQILKFYTITHKLAYSVNFSFLEFHVEFYQVY